MQTTGDHGSAVSHGNSIGWFGKGKPITLCFTHQSEIYKRPCNNCPPRLSVFEVEARR
jgi:hypothetical protein